jgi:uncharacterized membrane protein YphA (DoxX/SURF4 family)
VLLLFRFDRLFERTLLMNTALLIARVFLALVLAVAGAAKLADREGSRQAIVDFGVPTGLAAPLGLLLPLQNWSSP